MEQLEGQLTQLQERYIFLIKEIVIQDKSSYGRLKKNVKEAERIKVQQFQSGEWEGPLERIGLQIKEDLLNEGYRSTQLRVIYELIEQDHKRKWESGESADQHFDDSIFDQTEEWALKALSDPQLDKLSLAQVTEVLKHEIDMRKSRKTIDNDRIKHLLEYAKKRTIQLVNKVTKQQTNPEDQGLSETFALLGELGGMFKVLSDMCYDLQKNVYVFRPSKVNDKKAVEELNKFMVSTLAPLSKILIEHCEGTKTILRNITDEKYSNTNRQWMQNAEDKFLNFGNHGSGEVNAVLTNKVVFKLDSREVKDEEGNIIKTVPVIVKTWVKRETTREEEGDKTIFQLQEFEGQVHVECPECKLKFNKPIVPDEQMDLIAGDLFHQAKTILLRDGLSNAIDILANNVVTEYVKDPIEWMKEEYQHKYKREPTEQELKDVEIREDQQKIKDVDIDPNDVGEKRHSMLGNIATRRLEKSQHFSDQA